MANIHIISSGSIGNCYILTDNRGKQIILDVGVKWDDIRASINIENVVLALVGHRHGDHSKSIKDCLYRGIPIYTNEDTANIYDGCNILKKGIEIEGFKIFPFELFHNVPNIGFLIEMSDGHRLVYATDTYKIPYKFKNIHTFLVEANYSEDVKIENYCNDIYSRSQSQNHMEIKETVSFFKANYSPSLQTIILCHLSDNGSNEHKFITMVKEELGFDNVFAANSGMKLELRKEAF